MGLISEHLADANIITWFTTGLTDSFSIPPVDDELYAPFTMSCAYSKDCGIELHWGPTIIPTSAAPLRINFTCTKYDGTQTQRTLHESDRFYFMQTHSPYASVQLDFIYYHYEMHTP